MEFAPTEEQQLIRASAREFLTANAGAARRRAALAMPEGYDTALWRQMTGELGWAALALPERYGGAGLSWVELCILQEELGRELVASPFLGTVALAAPLILAAGSESQRAALLPRIAAGELRVACAVSGNDGRPPPEGVSVQLQGDNGRWLLQGSSDFVIHADQADLLLVLARDAAGGSRAVLVEPSRAGVAITPRTMLDLTRPMSQVSFSAVAVGEPDLLDADGDAGAAIQRALHLAQVALAAEALGGAQQVLDMTLGYARQRVQFGRAIGSFQAIKHRLADMMVQLEAARSAAWYAALAAAGESAELAQAAAIAKSCCCEAFFDCAASALQIHGGIGFTWEHDAHLYFKRARASSTLLGSPAWHRERLVRLAVGGAVASPVF